MRGIAFHSDNVDCNSGYCIQSPQGKVCTKTCIEECPGGFQCESFSVGGGDPTFLCMPRYPTLCYPCASNDECVLPGVDAPARCVRYGDNGSFCGGECALGGDDCPDHFVCLNAEVVEGNQTAQCVPTDDSNQVKVCSCTPAAISDAASTTCSRTNGFGSCGGERTCGLGGLSACSATEPQSEFCNGVDDDCDGVTDPENSNGCQFYYLDDDEDGQATDVDDDGTPEVSSRALTDGLWDVNGDGFPDQIHISGKEIRVQLWNAATGTFVENVPVAKIGGYDQPTPTCDVGHGRRRAPQRTGLTGSGRRSRKVLGTGGGPRVPQFGKPVSNGRAVGKSALLPACRATARATIANPRPAKAHCVNGGLHAPRGRTAGRVATSRVPA